MRRFHPLNEGKAASSPAIIDHDGMPFSQKELVGAVRTFERLVAVQTLPNAATGGILKHKLVETITDTPAQLVKEVENA